MGELSKRLTKAKIIGLDTSLFIYFLEENKKYSPLSKITLKGMEDSKWEGVTSTITLMEITVHPWQTGREKIAREYEARLVHFPNLSIVDVDRNVARIAAQLRARYNVSPPDALQVAASLAFGAKAFLTNDKRLSKLQELIDVLVLDDFVE
ncbi:MAG: PIN domain-containing protein [Anaerolineales bacterium]|nr:PIN domain-containing protein [Anaerolineales bacterium]MCZ2123031.1 PIN domain-containing protein [Anaerolineales bacterium]